jgi:CubicO group peptidase (beta-lactamase class C family)
MPRTLELIHRGVDQRLHVGAQLYASLRGNVVAHLAVGEARIGTPMTTRTIIRWHSAGKPITAVAIAQLWERGLLGLDDPVIRHVPEFAAGGKEAITIRHLLTHTGGFLGELRMWTKPWDEVMAYVCALPLEPGWVPGRKAAYHGASSWYILGEIVQRLTGERYPRYLREHIFQPIGMNDSWIGMSAEAYRAYVQEDRLALLYNTSKPIDPAQPLPDESECGGCSPGGRLFAPAYDVGRFYEMLLAHGSFGGAEVILPQAVEALTARHRVGMFDHTFQRTMDWGLGFMINSEYHGIGPMPYGYGRHASLRAFGHGGMESSIAFADPEHGLAVACILNGMPGERAHHIRMNEILSALYEDLGLTP